MVNCLMKINRNPFLDFEDAFFAKIICEENTTLFNVEEDKKLPLKKSEDLDYNEGDVQYAPGKACPADPTGSNIALKAAEEARAAAAAQQIAAAQASHQVKVQLAEKAIQAARAAQAALAGKLVQVNQLEREVCDTKAILMRQPNACKEAQLNLKISMTAAIQSAQLLSGLLNALKLSQTATTYAQKAKEGLSESLLQKAALLKASKCRLEILMRELAGARQDLVAVSEAAKRARAAAKAACSCAERCKRNSKFNKLDSGVSHFMGKATREVKQLLQKASKK